jgi:mRNA interferase RelE/StbE
MAPTTVTGEPYDVRLTSRAHRQLEKLSPADGARLRRPVFSLAFQPRPPGAAQVVGSSRWRIRIGDLRVVYEIDDPKRMVIVTKIARRSESTYRRL